MVATADLHGHLPTIEPCDLLLIAGDVCPTQHRISIPGQRHWLEREFADWIAGDRCHAKRVVWISGNHDYAVELGGPGRRLRRAATYLQDQWWGVSADRPGPLTSSRDMRDVQAGQLIIWGTPWSSGLPNAHAFALPETLLDRAYRQIPIEADVVVVHGPPLGYGDLTADGRRIGSEALWARLSAVRPRLTVFGHCHPGYGLFRAPWGGQLANASLVDDDLRPVNRPMVFAL